MQKELSTHAQVAALIRKELKSLGLKHAKVRSSSFAGGNAVDVYVYNVNPELCQKLEAQFAKYEYGHFDGMNDIYEFDNVRKDIPQVKFLMVHNERTPDMLLEIHNYRKKMYNVTTDEQCMREWNCWLSQLDWKVFNDKEFWKQAQNVFADFQPKFKQEPAMQEVRVRI